MALLQEIKVPLISVNDTSLTVISLPFQNGSPVKEGEIILEFETSKTTYDVISENDGFVQYLCKVDTDYSVNEIVAKIFSVESEIEKNIESVASTNQLLKQHSKEPISDWTGETLFTKAALKLIESSGTNASVFSG